MKTSYASIAISLFAITVISCSPKVSKTTNQSTQITPQSVQSTIQSPTPSPSNEKLDMGKENPRSIPASTIPVDRTQLIKK